MIGAGLVAQKAVARGLKVRPWVKTSLAPGSQVVTDYLAKAGSTRRSTSSDSARRLWLHHLHRQFGSAAGECREGGHRRRPRGAAVLSGNRNFEGRVHPQVRANYLASPMLVVAYALAGSINLNLTQSRSAYDKENEPVYLREIWPSPKEIAEAIRKAVKPASFRKRYGNVFDGGPDWKKVKVVKGQTYAWDKQIDLCEAPALFRRHDG
jgi:aconitate hydratase